jgi:hypothetical protein
MKGIDVRAWSFLDWTGALCFAAGALIPAINAALKDLPDIASRMPAFFSWVYLPPALILVTFGVILYRQFEKPRQTPYEVRSTVRSHLFPHVQFEPPSDFKLLPQQYVAELTAQLPYIEARFFVVSFLSSPIILDEVKLSLRLFGSVPLESIPLIHHEWQVEPKDAPIVVCRRNLTDSELRNLPWTAGRESGSFELFAKARHNDRTITYGPISSMVIEGWVNLRKKNDEKPPPEPDTSNPIPLLHVDGDLISLSDAAARVYEELKKPPHFWSVIADNHARGDPDAILDSIAGLMAGKIAIYGRQLPQTRISRLDLNEQTRVKFEGGAKTMHFLLFKIPPCVDLQVKSNDVDNLIQDLRSGLAASTPI